MKDYERVGSVFTITEDHLKLAKRLHFYPQEQDYSPSPAVDSKRPFGNSGDVAYEVHEVLTGEQWDWGDYDDNEMPEDLHEKYTTLFYEMYLVLQICCVFQEFKTGKFKRTFYGCTSWERID